MSKAPLTIPQYRKFAKETFKNVEEQEIDGYIRFIVTDHNGKKWERTLKK